MENTLSKYLPFWKKLSNEHQKKILTYTIKKNFKIKEHLYSSVNSCSGIEIVKSGRVRVYIMSPHGGEITLYRLLSGDICVLSAACIINSLDVEVNMEFEEETELYIIPKNIYKEINDSNSHVQKFTTELLSGRFSDVIWVLQQIVFTNMGSRLAQALIEHSVLEESNKIHITHEKLANDLGTAREVVSRLLKQFEIDNIVMLSRGTIEIIDIKKLRAI